MNNIPNAKLASNILSHSYGGDHTNTTGNKFEIQSKNNTIKSIHVTWNLNYIENIQATFFGDTSDIQGHNPVSRDTTSHIYNTIHSQSPTTQSHSLSFELYPGEYIVGNIIIIPTRNQSQLDDDRSYYELNQMYYFTQAYDKSVAFITFRTSYDRVFEAGSRSHLVNDLRYIFPADKSFLAGIEGYSDLNTNRIISVGFGIWTFENEYFDDLKWVDQYTDELEVKSTLYDDETEMFCNNTNKDTSHVFEIRNSQGDYRCTWLDHPFLDIQDVKFENEVVIPTISKYETIIYEPYVRYQKTKKDEVKNRSNKTNKHNFLNELYQHEFKNYYNNKDIIKTDTLNLTYDKLFNKDSIRKFSNKLPADSRGIRRFNTETHQLIVERNKCAKLRFNYKISKYDNAKFIFTHNFQIDGYGLISFYINGYTSMEKQVDNSLEIVITSSKTKNTDNKSNNQINDYVSNKSNIYDIFNIIEDREEEYDAYNSDTDTLPRINSDNDLLDLIDV